MDVLPARQRHVQACLRSRQASGALWSVFKKGRVSFVRFRETDIIK